MTPPETAPKPQKFEIVFTKPDGTVATTWNGYFSAREAQRALNDADLCIPMSWKAEIQPEEIPT